MCASFIPLNAYRRGGVRKYVVWRSADQAIDWFLLESGRYAPLAAGEQGLLRRDSLHRNTRTASRGSPRQGKLLSDNRDGAVAADLA